ncbi:MAG: mannonate dehydratase [Chloroflexota bacterium]
MFLFVPLWEVCGIPDNFVGTFHDDGKIDMLACLWAYRDIGFEGIYHPDHVPTMEGDSNVRAGYSSTGRLFSIGYLRELQQAVFAEPTP